MGRDDSWNYPDNGNDNQDQTEQVKHLMPEHEEQPDITPFGLGRVLPKLPSRKKELGHQPINKEVRHC
jgi:hypothetical protein